MSEKWIKAITLWEPWATLVALGEKNFETRSWKTSYRGPLAIHAAKRAGAEQRECFDMEPFRSVLKEAGYETFDALPFGCVVAVANLARIWTTDRLRPHIEAAREREKVPALAAGLEHELAFGDYAAGRYGWYLQDIERISPVPARGSQGLWMWMREVEEKE